LLTEVDDALGVVAEMRALEGVVRRDERCSAQVFDRAASLRGFFILV
jgi:hypothetical protein